MCGEEPVFVQWQDVTITGPETRTEEQIEEDERRFWESYRERFAAYEEAIGRSPIVRGPSPAVMWADELTDFTSSGYDRLRRYFTAGNPDPDVIDAVTGIPIRPVQYMPIVDFSGWPITVLPVPEGALQLIPDQTLAERLYRQETE